MLYFKYNRLFKNIYYASCIAILLVEHCYCIFNNMEKITLNYLIKNILIPDKTTYYIKMIEKIESMIKRIRFNSFQLYSTLFEERPTNRQKRNIWI